jgi:hypothetical protein
MRFPGISDLDRDSTLQSPKSILIRLVIAQIDVQYHRKAEVVTDPQRGCTFVPVYSRPNFIHFVAPGRLETRTEFAGGFTDGIMKLT